MIIEILLVRIPLTARLLKGVYILRPPPPRYSSPWDVSKATDYFKTSAPLLELSLKLLASAQRPQTFSASDQNFRKESQNSISFVATPLLKTSKAVEVC